MNPLAPETLATFQTWARQEAPREACGLVVVEQGREVFRPCANVAEDPHSDFRIAAQVLTEAEDQGLLAILHSHPYRDAAPSLADRVGCERTAHPWVILGAQGDWVTLEPNGFQAPLIGRPYVWGTLDCWALVRDWFAQERGVVLPDFPRIDRFWERGQDIFAERAEAAGFLPVEDLRPGDVLAMAIRARVANHLAIYLGDQVILHHRTRRLSGREQYGGLWLQATTRIYRHRSLA